MNTLIKKIINIGIGLLAAIAVLSPYFVIIKDANTEVMGSLIKYL